MVEWEGMAKAAGTAYTMSGYGRERFVLSAFMSPANGDTMEPGDSDRKVMMETYQLWAREILEKVRAKMAWVSEKTGTRSHIQQMDPAAMTTAPLKMFTGTGMMG